MFRKFCTFVFPGKSGATPTLEIYISTNFVLKCCYQVWSKIEVVEFTVIGAIIVTVIANKITQHQLRIENFSGEI